MKKEEEQPGADKPKRHTFFVPEITNLNVTSHGISGEEPVTREHVRNNSNLRKYLLESGIRPEDLPAEEDTRKLERRVKSSDKKLLKGENKKRKGGEK